MGEWEDSNIDMDFAGDGECYVSDAYLAKRFSVTGIVVKCIGFEEVA